MNPGKGLIGNNLAHYNITHHLGSGGMGDVYQATDSRLGRNVALKVLPETFAQDAERVARLEREARMLAALNHPNIAFIFGLERVGDRNFLVMELVDGETLAERIKRGPVPLDEALAISRQILEALEGAHEKGVIHRDLKPANIKITSDGKVKVLDFGLAKTVETESANAVTSNSPTLSMAATQAGMILGTAAYMSPEQAKGKTVDRRTDVFAFGCIMYEMLTGKPAFDGEDATEILGAVVRLEPDWVRLPANTPQRIHELLRLSLDKNVKNRRSTATDVRLDIEAAAKETATPAASLSAARGGKPVLAWVVATALLVAVVLLTIPYFRSTPALPVMRFEIQSPKESTFTFRPGMLMEISPDGRYLAFVASVVGKRPQLYIRAIDELDARPVPAFATGSFTTGGRPFWSPDSRFVAFSSEGQLKKVDVTATGASPQVLCNIPGNVNGAWGHDAILFSGTGTNGLLRVSPEGGTPTPFTTLDAGETQHQALGFLPDGKHFLLAVRGSTPGDYPVFVASVDSKERTRLVNSFYRPAFASPDRLFFVRDHALFVQKFNTRTYALEGEAARIMDSVSTNPAGNAGFSVSQNGLLVFAPGTTSAESELTWYDRSGKVLSQAGTATYKGIDLSPDGKRVAVHYHAEGAPGGDVWIIDLERNNTPTRLTFDESQDNSSPIWSPDGLSVAFSSIRNNRYGIYRKASNGVGTEELLFESETPKVPSSWSPDGKSIVFVDYAVNTSGSGDLWILPLTGDRKPTPYLQSPANEIQAQISPNGRWVAYTSGSQVWVQSYPVPGTKYRVSEATGGLPRWRADGKELFFSAIQAGRIWSASVSPNGPGLKFGAPQLLFDRLFYSFSHGPTNYHTYAVSADGQKILAPRQPEVDTGSQSVTVVVNWKSLLK